MACLLLRCVAPMQSWGTRSRFQERDTEREPTKSGIIGLLCAALGQDRSQPLDDLVALRMGVRVDREGKMEWDYHTTLNVIKANQKFDKEDSKNTQISTRAYLADAAFLVGLEGDLPLLKQLQQKLKNPCWPLFLGRKSFVPGCPVYLPDGLQPDKSLEEALNDYPSIAPKFKRDKKQPLPTRLILDCPTGEISHEKRQDIPLDFRHAHRQFHSRQILVTPLKGVK